MASRGPDPPQALLTMNMRQLGWQPKMSGLSQGLNETMYTASRGPDPPQALLTMNMRQLGCQPKMSGLSQGLKETMYMVSRGPDPPQALLTMNKQQLEYPQQLIEGRTDFPSIQYAASNGNLLNLPA